MISAYALQVLNRMLNRNIESSECVVVRLQLPDGSRHWGSVVGVGSKVSVKAVKPGPDGGAHWESYLMEDIHPAWVTFVTVLPGWVFQDAKWRLKFNEGQS
ncbi:hypothetical protein [Rhodococcus qingshengii]|uniref:hypothetical protein n=1 Tax=Rhodococcus qingshengii TaxID=334542 RepID=UPI0035DE35C1